MKIKIKKKSPEGQRQNQYQYNVIFRPEDEGGFTAIVPSLPGCITYGKTLKEAQEMIADAIEGYVVSVAKHKEVVSSDEGNFISTMNFSLRSFGNLSPVSV